MKSGTKLSLPTFCLANILTVTVISIAAAWLLPVGCLYIKWNIYFSYTHTHHTQPFYGSVDSSGTTHYSSVFADASSQSSELWSMDKIRAYFCHVRSLTPVLTDARRNIHPLKLIMVINHPYLLSPSITIRGILPI